MTDWTSPEAIARDAAIFTKFMHALLGVYAFEWIISLDFDWAFLTGKKKFRWPMIFYFANRYLLLFAMIGIAIALDTTTEVDCQALYTFNQIAGDAAVGLGSINLAIRTVAIWSHNRYIIIGLILIILGHWSLILQGVQLKAVWMDGVGCVITEANNKILAAIFIYSMIFDLLILLVNTYKLLGLNSAVRAVGTSRLSKMIFEDGLIFFFIAFVANLLATIFMLLDLNQIMSIIFNVPAAVLSTIVACRAVRRLQNFSMSPDSQASASMTQNRANPRISTKHNTQYGNGKPGVHVQMETFTHAEDNFGIDSKSDGRAESDTTNVEVDLEAAKQRGNGPYGY